MAAMESVSQQHFRVKRRLPEITSTCSREGEGEIQGEREKERTNVLDNVTHPSCSEKISLGIEVEEI